MHASPPAARAAVVLSCAGAPDGDLNVVRALGRQGIPVYVAAEYASPPAASSRYCKELLLMPSFRREPEAVVAALVDLARRLGDKPVLFPTADPDLQMVTDWRERLDPHFEIPIAPPALVRTLSNKSAFAALAARHSLPVPATWPMDTTGDVETVAARLSYPVIVKPADTCIWTLPEVEAIVGVRKALIARTHDEFVEACRPLMPYAKDLLVQRYIPGDDEQYYDLQAYIDRSGNALAWFTGRKIRTMPPAVGAGCYVESRVVEQLAAVGLKCLRDIGFTGLADLDFKYDPASRSFLLIEINPRTAAWGILPTAAGVNLPYVAYADLTNQTATPACRQREFGRYLHFGNDLRAFRQYRRRGEWSMGRYLRSLLGKRLVFQFWSVDDPAPFLSIARASLRSRAARLGRHLQR